MGRQIKDLTGQIFGRLTVLGDTKKRKQGNVVWHCRCTCGNIAFVRSASLVNGKTISCGCYNQEMHKVIDLTGRRFGRWLVLERSANVKYRKSHKTMWQCQCDCGVVKIVSACTLSGGVTKSCGCLQIEKVTKHNHCKYGKTTKEYAAHHSMIQRCYNPNDDRYYDYGGRGLIVEPSYLDKKNGFIKWLNEVGYAPSPKHSIDRINNDLGYVKGNMKWSTSSEQNKNRRPPADRRVAA